MRKVPAGSGKRRSEQRYPGRGASEPSVAFPRGRGRSVDLGCRGGGAGTRSRDEPGGHISCCDRTLGRQRPRPGLARLHRAGDRPSSHSGIRRFRCSGCAGVGGFGAQGAHVCPCGHASASRPYSPGSDPSFRMRSPSYRRRRRSSSSSIAGALTGKQRGECGPHQKSS